MQTELIWNQFKAELLAFLNARVKNPTVAEDLLQEIFIKIHLNLESLKKSDKLLSWLYQITRNTLIDYYRNSNKNQSIEIKEEYLDNYFESNRHNFNSCLKSFIPYLDQKDQEAIIKTSFEGVSQKEYAQQINLSYPATKSRVQRARHKLKDLFIACCNVKTDGYGNIISSTNENCNC